MPSRVSFDWRGPELVQRVRTAAAEAVNETVDAARDDAEATHPWKNDVRERLIRGQRVDTELEKQIRAEHATAADPNPTARFGYTRRPGFYGLFHELGTVHEHEYPTLRPSAARHFPSLLARLREKLK